MYEAGLMFWVKSEFTPEPKLLLTSEPPNSPEIDVGSQLFANSISLRRTAEGGRRSGTAWKGHAQRFTSKHHRSFLKSTPNLSKHHWCSVAKVRQSKLDFVRHLKATLLTPSYRRLIRRRWRHRGDRPPSHRCWTDPHGLFLMPMWVWEDSEQPSPSQLQTSDRPIFSILCHLRDRP